MLQTYETPYASGILVPVNRLISLDLYANPETDIKTVFNWDQILHDIATQRKSTAENPYYLVVFRSLLKENADRKLLAELDADATIEAKRSRELMAYYPGETNAHRRSMSFCVWTGQQAAREAVAGPAHQKATQIGPKMYDWHDVRLFNISLINDKTSFEQTHMPHPH